MFCRNCGKEIDDKAYVCIHCGCLTSTKKPSEQASQKTFALTDKAKTSIIVGAIVLVVFFAVLFGCLYGIPLEVTLEGYHDLEGLRGYNQTEGLNINGNVAKVTRGSTFKPPYTSKDGYTFKGWFKDYSCTSPWLSTDRVTSNITLYAKWEKIE